MANHVFISYNRADRAYARKLAEHLRGQGFEVWIDDHIEYGAEWPRAIREAVRSCAAFTVVMTPDAERSFWVGCEIDEARNRRKPIFPLLRAGEVFFGLNTIQSVDVTGGKLPGPDLTARLIRAGVPCNRPAAAPRKSPPKASRAQRALLWAIGVLCVLIVAILGPWLFRQVVPPTPTATTEPSRTVVTVAPTPTATEPAAPTPVPTPVATAPPAVTPTSPSAGMPTPVTGATWARAQDGAVMVYVPAGEFLMGSTQEEVSAALAACSYCSSDAFDNELPQHRVFVEAFWIDRTEVTNAQYEMCVDAVACTPPQDVSSTLDEHYYGNPEYGNYPVIYVTWHQARDYAAWVGGRLPTEAEWEYAARGPEGSVYTWGNVLPRDQFLNYHGNLGGTTPVGSYPDGKSWCNALDMLGNVWEWTSSLDKGYPYDATDGRENEAAEGYRVLRGGSWEHKGEVARCAARVSNYPDGRVYNSGFRVCLSWAGSGF